MAAMGSSAVPRVTSSNAMLWVYQRGLSNALFLANLLVYPWLVIATIWRAIQFHAGLLTDLANPCLVFSFFTLIAA
jgi:hypothetical protein